MPKAVIDKPTPTPKASASVPATERVLVRYDASCDRWAVVDNTGKPTRHFEFGVLVDVQFTTATTTEMVRLGCGSEARKNTVGVASGTLMEGVHGRDFVGFHNLGFNGDAFVDEDGNPLTSARKLRLMPGRRALYKI